jgi:hypothetical protein
VIAEALKVLRVVAVPGRLKFAFEEVEAGAACYRRTGEELPRETLEVCQAADAILFGAAGLPDVRFPDGTEIAPSSRSDRLDSTPSGPSDFTWSAHAPGSATGADRLSSCARNRGLYAPAAGSCRRPRRDGHPRRHAARRPPDLPQAVELARGARGPRTESAG